MNGQIRRKSFYLSVAGAFTALLLTGTLAHAQAFYSLDWSERFNNSVGSETEDCWVANSYTASAAGTHILSISLPIVEGFPDNTAISGFIYQGADTLDPTAGGGLFLLGEVDTTFSGTPGIVTLTFNPPIDVGSGTVFYAAVLLRQVPSNKFPFDNDSHYVRNRSYFDVGLTPSGAYDVNQLPANSANITVFGGVHPVMGGMPGDVQSAGTLALWVNATATP